MSVHHETLLSRSFCKSDWMKPKFVDKPYSERPELPFLQNKRGHDKVRYGELWTHYKEHDELSKLFAKNGNIRSIFAFLGWCDPGNTDGTKTENTDSLQQGKSKRDEVVEALIQTYSELQAFATPRVKKSGNLAEVESAIEAATLNATTANADDGEKLTQKLETIEEVPLVEADPDIIRPPKTSGPAVMNTTEPNNEEIAKHSDFQIGEDLGDLAFTHREATKETEAPNRIKNYFESNKEEASKKPNFNEMVTLNAVPEIQATGEVSLKELMERVRERNRLLRCRDIDQQLNTTGTTMDDKNRPQQPSNRPTIQPGWGWPNTSPNQQPQYNVPQYPYISNPSPQKSEPITPDNRPGYNRATKVNPVKLALHLGPLIAAIENAGILFPLLTIADIIPKTEYQLSFTKTDEAKRATSCQLEIEWTPKLSKTYFTVLRAPDIPQPFPIKTVLAKRKLFDFKYDIIYFSTFIRDVPFDLTLEAKDDGKEDRFCPTSRIPFDENGNWLKTADDKYLLISFDKDDERPGNNDQNV